jgi:DNA-binding XRE family transcriptional regulator
MAKPRTPPATPVGAEFGRHIRRLRRARDMTQEQLAERSGLSSDTIRRLELADFSPSLDTTGRAQPQWQARLVQGCRSFSLKMMVCMVFPCVWGKGYPADPIRPNLRWPLDKAPPGPVGSSTPGPYLGHPVFLVTCDCPAPGCRGDQEETKKLFGRFVKP